MVGVVFSDVIIERKSDFRFLSLHILLSTTEMYLSCKFFSWLDRIHFFAYSLPIKNNRHTFLLWKNLHSSVVKYHCDIKVYFFILFNQWISCPELSILANLSLTLSMFSVLTLILITRLNTKIIHNIHNF